MERSIAIAAASGKTRHVIVQMPRRESSTRALGWTDGVYTGWLIHVIDKRGRKRTARVGKCVRGHESSYRITYRPLPDAHLKKAATVATLAGPKALSWRRVPEAMVQQAALNTIRARIARLEAKHRARAARLAKKNV